MAIIHMCRAGEHPEAVEHPGHPGVFTYKTHHGLCLAEREANSYHDSDFYMTVWNEAEGKPEEILFASTRGWTYPCYGSYVDATPEVIAKHEAWKAAEAAKRKAAYRAAEAAKVRALRANIKLLIGGGERYLRALKLRRQIGPAKFEAMIKFLGRKFRNKFKLSLRNQIIGWFNEAAPQYPTPLSRKQWESVN